MQLLYTDMIPTHQSGGRPTRSDSPMGVYRPPNLGQLLSRLRDAFTYDP